MAVDPRRTLTDPVRGYNFVVTLVETADPLVGALTSTLGAIQNIALGGFSECSGIEMSLDVEERFEGGNNATVRKYPTRVNWSNIRLKRGVTLSDDLWNWHYDFVQGKGRRRDGIILLQNDLHVPVRVWHFRRGLPVRWVGPTMNATRSDVAVEELEVAHEGLDSYGVSQALEAPTDVSF